MPINWKFINFVSVESILLIPYFHQLFLLGTSLIENVVIKDPLRYGLEKCLKILMETKCAKTGGLHASEKHKLLLA